MPIPSPLVSTVLPDTGRLMDTPGNDLAARIVAAAFATLINVFGATPEVIRDGTIVLVISTLVGSLCDSKLATMEGLDKKEYHRKLTFKLMLYTLVVTVFGCLALMYHQWFLLQTGISALCGAQLVFMMKMVSKLGKSIGFDLENLEGLFRSVMEKKKEEEVSKL